MGKGNLLMMRLSPRRLTVLAGALLLSAGAAAADSAAPAVSTEVAKLDAQRERQIDKLERAYWRTLERLYAADQADPLKRRAKLAELDRKHAQRLDRIDTRYHAKRAKLRAER